MRKFWNWVRNEDDGRTLYLNGVIAEDPWFDDEVSPQAFKDELNSGDGDITVWINSPGGDVFAAAQIYTMLKEYAGKVTVKIDSLAASAASVVAMAGDEVCMSPVGMIMIHNPATYAWGDSEEMRLAKEMLDEVKESIINAYAEKTGRQRAMLSRLMDDETWMNARKALELGFIDKILYEDDETEPEPKDDSLSFIFSRTKVTNCLINKFQTAKPPSKSTETPKGTPIESLDKRLSLLSH